MKTANIADLKSHLSEYLHFVLQGELVQVCNRNTPIALITPVAKKEPNLTVLGSGRGSVEVKCDLTEPSSDQALWDMLK